MIPKIPFFYFFNNKAISRFLSEFLILIISLSIIGISGLFLSTYSKNLSYNPKIEIIEAKAISWSGGTLIKLNIANIGNVKLTLIKVSIKGIGDIFTGSKVLDTSQNYEIEANIPSQPIGKKLTIIASSIDPNGKTIEIMKNVEVMP